MALVLAVFQLAFLLAGCSGEASQAAVPGAGEAQGLVYDASQQVWYDDVEGAFAAVGEGGALYLYGDARAGALQAAADGVTFDLQGHELTMDLRGSGARGGAGLAHAGLAFGAGENALRNGRVNVTLGGTPETAQSAAGGYRGVSSAEGGALQLSSVRLSVRYGGESTIQPNVQVYGVEAGGAVSIADGSQVSVVAASADGGFGASAAAGVRAAGASGEVELSADSRISVNNNAAQVVQGAVGYPSAIMGTTKESNVELAELAVGPQLDWYDDLLQLFVENAQFDDRGDDAGLVYGAEVYYAPALELPNGLLVWAFSDAVAAQDAGRLESIVPAHVFVRSDYALPLEAYGIWCAQGRAGAVVQEGEIDVQTTAGYAAGVFGNGEAPMQADEDAISATCGNASFRVNVGAFDLADYEDVPAADGAAVVYPEKSTYTAVRNGSSAAAATATLGDEPWAPSDEPIAFSELFADWDELGAAPQEGDDGGEGTFGVTLCYYRMGREGYLYTGEEAGTYVYEEGIDLMPIADARVKAGDVVEVGGMQYRFLGWSPRRSDKQPLYTDHLYVREGNWGSFGAKFSYYGIYEQVQEGAAATGGAATTGLDADNLPSGGLQQGEDVAQAGGSAAGGAQQGGGSGQAAASATGAVAGSGALAGAATATEAAPASPAGGIAVLSGFAALVAAACALWYARGRSVAALGDARAVSAPPAAPDSPAPPAAPDSPGSPESPAPPAAPDSPMSPDSPVSRKPVGASSSSPAAEGGMRAGREARHDPAPAASQKGGIRF